MNNQLSNELSKEDISYIKRYLNKNDLKEFFDIAAVAGAYKTITRGIPGVYEGTHQFIRDIEIAKLLQQKFPNMPYNSSEGFKSWLTERISGSPQSGANALSRLQGDGAGEVDFVREMQGNLRSLFTKTDFARDASGNITSNIPGIDAVEVNRFTDKVLNEFQIKTLRSEDNLNKVLKEFTNNNHYNENITLVGPKELIEEAKKQGLPNPVKIIGSVEKNAKSAEALKDKVQSGQLTTELTTKAVVGKVVGGAIIGAAISIGISSIFNYIAYKKGAISKKDMLSTIGKDVAKGAITGGALAGISLFVPGGIIGMGIGIVVGSVLRRALDDAFGDGIFAEILDLTKSVQANVKLLHNGSVYIAELVEADGKQIARAVDTVQELVNERLNTVNRLQNFENHYQIGHVVIENKSFSSKLENLDKMKERLERNLWEV
ncbi:hypothetical protein AN960_20875 [Bacillus sp. FJAT-25509]|uniref:hypothetical protein n=1 Tax=Bacillus sp. FJAT-25509 TaxID=1712029 RepID=UPI0006F2577F|nr:hypothetical protein [Bacillus sp. FJAT-25509]KQL33531.1 hypothetical protein AN960_20875 [Bacillus sp. FJAT-25509]